MEPLEWCRQRLLVPGNSLTITLPYAPAGSREAILALRAVISEIAMIPGAVSDPDVARHKLVWWRQALAERLPHPAVQSLVETGFFGRFAPDSLDPLIDAVAASLEFPRFEQNHELWKHCLELARPGAQLEARIADPGADRAQAALAEIAGAGYLVRVVRDLARDARANRWLVPLQLQAAYQVTRSDVAAGQAGRAFDGLVRDLLEMALRAEYGALERLDTAGSWRHRHQLLGAALDRHLAIRLYRRPRQILKERIPPSGLMGGWVVWRRARRLRRQWHRAGRPEPRA